MQVIVPTASWVIREAARNILLRSSLLNFGMAYPEQLK
jgi:hypothetical protein